MKSIYIKTSVVSYLTSRPSRDLRAAAWQQIISQWWEKERSKYELFTSELVVAEASAGNQEAAMTRLAVLESIAELPADEEVKTLAARHNTTARKFAPRWNFLSPFSGFRFV